LKYLLRFLTCLCLFFAMSVLCVPVMAQNT